MALVHCVTVPEEWPARSNHIPIVMALSAAPEIQTEVPRPNYRAADWEVVRAEMALRLKELEVGSNIHTVDEFNTRLDKLIHAIPEVIDIMVPKSKLVHHQIWWWLKELQERCKEV